MAYRPDPVFNDSLETEASTSFRGAISLSIAAVLSLCFAFAVTVCLLLRAVFNAPGHLFRQIMH